MKKVSIFTLIGANNIGAFLQGFALTKVLAEKGYDYEFVTMPPAGENSSKVEKIKRYLRQKNFRLLFFKIKSGKKYAEARKILKTVPFESEKEYDAVVVGSDEMWNLATNTFTQHPQYFGKQIKAKKIISYAPSAGNTTISLLKESGYDFRSFDYLSVRDQRTFDLVTAVDSRIPVKVLDPTFLLASYDELLPEIPSTVDFILVYSYGVQPEEIKKIQAFAREKKLPLYSVGTYNKWCDKNILVEPFEFLAYLKKAKYVITSTFHGTALSINFNKQFAVCVEGSEKVQSLLNEFDLIGRAVSGGGSIGDMMKQAIDYEALNRRLMQRRAESIAYIERALGEKSDGICEK